MIHVACGGGQQGCTGAVTLQGELFTFGILNSQPKKIGTTCCLDWLMMVAATQRFFIFTRMPGEMIQFDYNIFQMG